MTTSTRSALFVDFDNVYLGLRDRAAAKLFATEPERWVQWLANGAGRAPSQGRRFLLQVCYLSPDRFGSFREHFVRAGFRVVDCPSSAGKNSADIHLVIDALDALATGTHYDEFVIASADADFAPLLHRLRAHDRRTTVLSGGPAAAASTSVCDSLISEDDLISALVADADRAVERTRARQQVPAQRGAANGAALTAAKTVRDLVMAAPDPVPGGAAAQAARSACPQIAKEGWPGGTRFAGFVNKQVPEVQWTEAPHHGYLVPRRVSGGAT